MKIETLPGGGLANTFTDPVGQSPINLWQAEEEYGLLETVRFPTHVACHAPIFLTGSQSYTARLPILHPNTGIHPPEYRAGERRYVSSSLVVVAAAAAAMWPDH